MPFFAPPSVPCVAVSWRPMSYDAEPVGTTTSQPTVQRSIPDTLRNQASPLPAAPLETRLTAMGLNAWKVAQFQPVVRSVKRLHEAVPTATHCNLTVSDCRHALIQQARAGRAETASTGYVPAPSVNAPEAAPERPVGRSIYPALTDSDLLPYPDLKAALRR